MSELLNNYEFWMGLSFLLFLNLIVYRIKKNYRDEKKKQEYELLTMKRRMLNGGRRSVNG